MNIADDTIPAELRARNQWVTWRLEKRDGRPTKVPYCANGRGRASSTDPATWSPFNIALAAHRSGAFDGVGYVLAAEDPFTGIDLDHVIEESGTVALWASEIIMAMASYTELSPSGTGVHIFVRGALPPGGNKRGNIEAYSYARYFTVTGQYVPGTPLTIEQRDPDLRTFHALHLAARQRSTTTPAPRHVGLDDRELLLRAIRASSGDRFAQLWSGDTSAFGCDHSVADLALCSRLAFWTGRDQHRVDRLFRASGLMREKWDERHYADGTTYGQRTIEVAISGGRDTYGGAHER